MNTRIMAYMVAAVAVGYLLISTVPGQVSMLVGPQEVLRASEAPAESAGVLSSGAEDKLGAQPGSLLFDLYKWWAVDLAVAFSVYWLARRKFA